MRLSIRTIAASGALVMALTGPAAATHTPAGEVFAPEYAETAVYLHCNGTKIGNVDAAANANRVTWDAKKPTASVTTGAGCGTLEPAVSGATNHNAFYDFPVRGTFTGNIKNITVRFWTIDTTPRALGKLFLRTLLVIDGTDIVPRATTGHTVEVAPVPSSTGIARLVEFTFTNIGLDSAEAHTAEHEIELTLESWYAVDTTANMWVYDASEVDSGLIINDATPAGVRVPRA